MKYLIAQPSLEVVAVNFSTVVFKNFKYNGKKYLSLFLCNCFTIAFLFILLDLKYNKDFIPYIQQDKSLNAVMVMVILIVILFAILFTSYSQGYFVRSRSKEFGVFLTLGMDKRELLLLIFIENMLITASALVLGLVSGTVLTKLFFVLTMKISRFEKLAHHYNLKSYVATAMLFLIIFVVVLISSVAFINRLDLTEVIKEGRKRDKLLKYHPSLLLSGIFALVISMLLIFYKVKEPYEQNIVRYLPLSTALCLSGTYLIISQLGNCILYFCRGSKRLYYNNLLFTNEIYYRFNRNKKIIFSCSILIGVIIFGLGLFYAFGEISVMSVDEMYPYDMSYAEVFGINNISKEKLQDIIEESKAEVAQSKELEFLLSNTYSHPYINNKNIDKKYLSLVSQKNLDEALFKSSIKAFNSSKLKNISVKKGEATLVKIEQSAKLSESFISTTFTINSDSTSYNLKCVNIITNELNFINLPLCNYMLVINDDEYEKVKNKDFIGNLHMITFKQWKKTDRLIYNLKAALKDENSKLSNKPKQLYSKDNSSFSLFSTIEMYNYRVKNSAFSNFISLFVSFLFLMASSLLLYFKIYTEFEEEKLKYIKLAKIGVSEAEFRSLIYKEFLLIFFAPLIFGAVAGYSYLFTMFKIMNFPIGFYLNSFYIFTIYFLFQIVYYYISSRKYVSVIISDFHNDYEL